MPRVEWEQLKCSGVVVEWVTTATDIQVAVLNVTAVDDNRVGSRSYESKEQKF